VIEKHGFRPHLYADDTQVYGRCTPSAIPDLQQRLSACIDEVHSWMQSNRLQLNVNKSELLWCATARRQHQLPTCPIRIGPDTITLSTAVRDLGIYIDSDLSMQHNDMSVVGCFAVLWQLCSIRRLVPSTVCQSLVTALVLRRLDYGNATLVGLPAYLLNRLQSVLNAAVRSITGLRRSEHITDALASFHWLRAPECIKFRLAVIVYQALQSWHCTSVLIRSDTARCRSADETPWSPLFVDFQSSRRPAFAMCYCR